MSNHRHTLSYATAIGMHVFAAGVAAQEELALTNARVISPCESRSWGPATLLIRNARIIALDSAHKVTIPATAQHHDLAGSYIIPGLIDGHFHVFQGDDSPAAVAAMRGTLEQLLRTGITSVRDMAGDARVLQRLAEQEKAGAASPRMFFAALFAGPQSFGRDPRGAAASRGLSPGSAPWMRAVSDTTDVEAVIRDAKATGATGIKLYVDLAEEIVIRLAAEAKRQGMRVWSHARIRPLPARRVIMTGVETVSHAHHFLDEIEAAERARLRQAAERGATLRLTSPQLRAVFDTMAARGVLFDPTLHLYETRDQSAVLRAAGAIVRVAREAGVRIVAGTDPVATTTAAPGGSSLPSGVTLVQRELELLVEYGGLTPLEALRAATCHAADALGMGQRLGSLRVGGIADLVVLRSDPLERISNVRDVRLVVKNGGIITPTRTRR